MEPAALELAGSDYTELKDPCPVWDGVRWHLFGTGCAPDRFEVFHAVAPAPTGPWRLRAPVDVSTLHGSCIGAPGVVADGTTLHLYLQTSYNELGGLVEHLVSDDGGETFRHRGTALQSDSSVGEAGLYDPHPCEVGGQRYLVYSAFSIVGQPDVHLARSASGSWDGPWERLGPVLCHEQVWCHNQRGVEAYEWGLEAAQLLELPDGRVLLNAVCFLPSGAPGTRQRVFVAVGEDVRGPFRVLGPVVDVPDGDGSGENGHACFVVDGEELLLFLQQRSLVDPRWGLALARTDVGELVDRSYDQEVA